MLAAFAASISLIPSLQHQLEAHYSTDKALETFRALLLNVGGALIGATAIVSSLVLFSMQVNVERMPHGLFRRLSSDIHLISAFACAFVLAIGVASLSMLVDKSRLAVITLVALWGVGATLALFRYAYKRALKLINPLQQLHLVRTVARKDLRKWSRRADRAKPLLENREEKQPDQRPWDSSHDLARTTYFKLNAHWTSVATQSVRHAMSFARRYSEQGDYEVSASALRASIAINAMYVSAKGKTFYGSNALIENPLTSDGFINDTLEHLRQHANAGIARRDEQQIRQTLGAYTDLVRVYLSIDYASPFATKTHAHLAAGYLTQAAQSVVPHHMPDVLMESVRLMGTTAQMMLNDGKPDDVVTMSEKIALVSVTGAAREEYRPVTREGMSQLAKLTFSLLRTTRRHDIHFAAEQVRGDVALVVNFFLKIPDTPIAGVHAGYLAPYYSSTSYESLRHGLVELANAISKAHADDTDARAVIVNLRRWADGMYKREKDLLLAAIQVRSHFAFDMIHWITGVTEVLLAVSNADACDNDNRQELQRHARWLIATLTWIPDDKETVAFIENFKLSETLFESAFDTWRRGCDELADDIAGYLLSWTFKAGRHATGWGVLEQGLTGAAVFALARGEPYIQRLKKSIADALKEGSIPNDQIRNRATDELNRRAETLHRRQHLSSTIMQAVEEANHADLKPLLQDIACVLCPIKAKLIFRLLSLLRSVRQVRAAR